MNLLYILLFIFIQTISLILTIIGLPVIAILSVFKLWNSSTPPQWMGGTLTWIWSNEIDGIFGPNNPQTRWQAFYWSAIRNSANNLRFVPGVSKVGRPFLHWTNGKWYAQAGWNDSGYPVLSAGSGVGSQ